MTRRAEILIIGNEILSGKVADEHGAFLCREFRVLGIDVRRIVVLPDEVEMIADAVRAASQEADLVVTTGGVGPTHDDVTMAGIALGLGRPLVRHPVLAALVRAIYGGDPNPIIDRMADLPEGASLIEGEGLRIPVICVENVYIFPGVPEIFRRKFHAIKDRFREPPFHLRTVHLGVDESVVAATLYAIAAAFPSVQLGSYPTLSRIDYRVKLTLESKNPEELSEAFAALMRGLPREAVVRVEEGTGPASAP